MLKRNRGFTIHFEVARHKPLVVVGSRNWAAVPGEPAPGIRPISAQLLDEGISSVLRVSGQWRLVEPWSYHHSVSIPVPVLYVARKVQRSYRTASVPLLLAPPRLLVRVAPSRPPRSLGYAARL